MLALKDEKQVFIWDSVELGSENVAWQEREMDGSRWIWIAASTVAGFRDAGVDAQLEPHHLDRSYHGDDGNVWNLTKAELSLSDFAIIYLFGWESRHALLEEYCSHWYVLPGNKMLQNAAVWKEPQAWQI